MILTSNNFYWLTNLNAKLLLKFHEDRMRNLDPRIIWIRDKGSFGVGNIQISAGLYETPNIYIVCVNISAYTKIEKDPSNGCAPHSMDHGSSGTLSIHIY